MFPLRESGACHLRVRAFPEGGYPVSDRSVAMQKKKFFALELKYDIKAAYIKKVK